MKIAKYYWIILLFAIAECMSPHERHALKKFQDEVETEVFNEFISEITILGIDEVSFLYATNIEYVGYCGIFIKSKRSMMDQHIPVPLNKVKKLEYQIPPGTSDFIIPDFKSNLLSRDFGVDQISKVFSRTKQGKFLKDKAIYQKSKYNHHG